VVMLGSSVNPSFERLRYSDTNSNMSNESARGGKLVGRGMVGRVPWIDAAIVAKRAMKPSLLLGPEG
jgi:hypothetical protein